MHHFESHAVRHHGARGHRRAHADAYSCGVVIVPYSAALPIVLFLYALVQRFGDAAEIGRLAGLTEDDLAERLR